MGYWNNPSQYACLADSMAGYSQQNFALSDPDCVAYVDTDLAGGSNIWYTDQPYKVSRSASGDYVGTVVQSNGPNYSDSASFPAIIFNPGIGLVPGTGTYNLTMLASYNLQSLYASVTSATTNRIFATWCAYNNQGSATICSSPQYETPNTVPAYQYTVNGNEHSVASYQQIPTYSDVNCTQPAHKVSCGIPLTGTEPDNYTQVPGGTCPSLYIKIQIPAYTLLCYAKPGTSQALSGVVPTEVLCGRIKQTWQY
jgi:hypothetical protein